MFEQRPDDDIIKLCKTIQLAGKCGLSENFLRTGNLRIIICRGRFLLFFTIHPLTLGWQSVLEMDLDISIHQLLWPAWKKKKGERNTILLVCDHLLLHKVTTQFTHAHKPSTVPAMYTVATFVCFCRVKLEKVNPTSFLHFLPHLLRKIVLTVHTSMIYRVYYVTPFSLCNKREESWDDIISGVKAPSTLWPGAASLSPWPLSWTWEPDTKHGTLDLADQMASFSQIKPVISAFPLKFTAVLVFWTWALARLLWSACHLRILQGRKIAIYV